MNSSSSVISNASSSLFSSSTISTKSKPKFISNPKKLNPFNSSSKLNNLAIPDELKIENYDRRPYVTTFDRLDLVVFFIPGKDNIGGIVSHFLDAIANHDQIVIEIEKQYDKIDELNSFYKKICRLFHNLDAAWNVVLNNNGKFYEFIALESELITQFGEQFVEIYHNTMNNSTSIFNNNNEEEEDDDNDKKKSILSTAITNFNNESDEKIELADINNFDLTTVTNSSVYIKSTFLNNKKNLLKLEELIEIIEDIDTKAKFQEIYNRYIELYNLCSKQKIVYDTYCKTRNKRDEILSLIKTNEKILFDLKEKEKILSYLICEDHIIANDLKKNIGEIFPNVHLGYIITSINGIEVENLPFTEVINKIKMAKSPHHVVFRRYDYRFNPYAGIWMTLEDLRQKGVCIDDPLLITSRLIDLASKGDKVNLYNFLLQGHDPNYEDTTGKTALFMAASNNFIDIAQLLLKAGCKINHRDRNRMTPLMYAVKKGLNDMVRFLIDNGADINVCDRFKRGLSYYAILSGNSSMIKSMIPRDLRDLSERIWGFTPLHIAANIGDFDTIKFLIQYGCSIYRQDNKKRTAEDIAKDNGYYNISKFLCERRLNAAGQKVYVSFRPFSIPNEYNSLSSSSSVGSISTSSSMYTLMNTETNKGINFELWIGNIDALDPKFCSEVNFTHIIFLRTTIDFPSQTQWVKRDRDLQFVSHYIPPPLCKWCQINRPRSSRAKDFYSSSSLNSSGNFSKKNSDKKKYKNHDYFQDEEKNEECECEQIEIDGEDNWDAIEELIGPTIVYIKNELNQLHDICLSREIHESERERNERRKRRISDDDESSDDENNNQIKNIMKKKNKDKIKKKINKLANIEEEDEEDEDIDEEDDEKVENEEEEEDSPEILDHNEHYVYEMTHQNLLNRNTMRLLICCKTGENLSPALAATIILLREGNGFTTSFSSSSSIQNMKAPAPINAAALATSSAALLLSPTKEIDHVIDPSNPPKRVDEIENHLKALRPNINLSERIKKGIFMVQHKLDTKRLKRAQARVRNSVVDSIGF